MNMNWEAPKHYIPIALIIFSLIDLINFDSLLFHMGFCRILACIISLEEMLFFFNAYTALFSSAVVVIVYRCHDE